MSANEPADAASEVPAKQQKVEATWALGIDSSTQSCSAVVVDTSTGRIVAEASVNYGADFPHYGAPNGFIPGGADGEVHADPLMMLDALDELLTRLQSKCNLSRVGAISGAGQQHGSVYLKDAWFGAVAELRSDASLAAQLGPCLARTTAPIWMDTSTSAECREIAAALGSNENVCAKSGSVAVERFTGPQIRRFFKTAPEAYESTARIHLISSFLCSVISGRDASIDTGDGAGMNLMNVKSYAWDDDLLAATAPGLREKLPGVVAGSTVVGPVSGYFVSKYGLPEGAPVVVFTGDNPSSLVGMGASRPGRVVISLGTSDTFFAALPEPRTDPEGFGHVFGNPVGGCMTLQCFLNGSLSREKVKNKLGMEWGDFSAALAETPVGNGGRLMVPFFGPEISPRVDLKTAPLLRGGEAFERWEEPKEAVRACVEGQFLNMKARTAWMQLTTEVVYLTGGASQNDEIAQVVANIFQAEVRRLRVSGSVALGGAMRAAATGMGLELEALERQLCTLEPGLVRPDSAAAAAYEGHANDLQKMISSAGVAAV